MVINHHPISLSASKDLQCLSCSAITLPFAKFFNLIVYHVPLITMPQDQHRCDGTLFIKFPLSTSQVPGKAGRWTEMTPPLTKVKFWQGYMWLRTMYKRIITMQLQQRTRRVTEVKETLANSQW